MAGARSAAGRMFHTRGLFDGVAYLPIIGRRKVAETPKLAGRLSVHQFQRSKGGEDALL